MSAEEATPTTSYTKPTIDDYGDVKELTAGGQLSGHLDGSYPVGTPDDFHGGLFQLILSGRDGERPGRLCGRLSPDSSWSLNQP